MPHYPTLNVGTWLRLFRIFCTRKFCFVRWQWHIIWRSPHFNQSLVCVCIAGYEFFFWVLSLQMWSTKYDYRHENLQAAILGKEEARAVSHFDSRMSNQTSRRPATARTASCRKIISTFKDVYIRKFIPYLVLKYVDFPPDRNFRAHVESPQRWDRFSRQIGIKTNCKLRAFRKGTA